MGFCVVWHDWETGRISRGVTVKDRSVAQRWLNDHRDIRGLDLWIEEVSC